MKRMGMVIGLRQEHVAEYKRLHADVWPDVLERLRRSNITNYSIFLREPENLMFSYWEYVGDKFDADNAEIAAGPGDIGMVENMRPNADSVEDQARKKNGGLRWKRISTSTEPIGTWCIAYIDLADQPACRLQVSRLSTECSKGLAARIQSRW